MTMVQSSASHFVRDLPSHELAQVMAKPKSFKMQYFAILAVGNIGREILSYGGASWENMAIIPMEWMNHKDNTPFGCMPLLFVKGENEKEIVLSEAMVVDTYLAKHFGLLGESDYEASLIASFYSSTAGLQHTFANAVTWATVESQAKVLDHFIRETLAHWIKNHEKHLRDNGSNGHYVGSSLTLADIRTSNAIEHLAHQPWAETLLAPIRASIELSKVRETVAMHPKIAEWRAGKEYARLSSNTTAFFQNPFTAILH